MQFSSTVHVSAKVSDSTISTMLEGSVVGQW